MSKRPDTAKKKKKATPMAANQVDCKLVRWVKGRAKKSKIQKKEEKKKKRKKKKRCG